MTDDVRTSSIPTAADALELLNDGLALCQQAIGKLTRARIALELKADFETIDERHDSDDRRFGAP